jgi:imidazolonepropionase-like amidohydrolase
MARMLPATPRMSLALKLSSVGVLAWCVSGTARLDVVSATPMRVRSQNAQSSLIEEPPDIPGNAVRYTVSMFGNKAGVNIVWQAPGGSTHIFFAYNDRGRGPRIEESYTTVSDGTVSSLHIAGNDYYKTPIVETFSINGGRGHWKNQAEAGATSTAGGMYVSMNGGPEELAAIVRAARRAGGALTLLPEGNARVRQVARLNLGSGGTSTTAILHSIDGLSLQPLYVWTDEAEAFLGGGDSWLFTIREGWESQVTLLVDVQRSVDRERAVALAKDLPCRPPSGLLAIRNVDVFDSVTGSVRRAQTVLVEGDAIQAVGAAADVRVPPGALVVDGRGKSLLPGLWDMHAHVGDPDGLLNLLLGITSVRDLGNDADELHARIQRIEEGVEVGTRIFPAGLIDGRGPYQGPTNVLADTEAEARNAVRSYANRGYTQIKIYSSLKPSLVPIVIDEARTHGMRVSGHIPAGMVAEDGVRAGMNEIQHANYLLLNFMPDVKDRTQTAARLTEVAKRGADIRVHSREMRAFIDLLGSHQVAIDPTLALFEERFVNRSGRIPESYVSVAARLPAQFRRSLLVGNLPVPDGMDQRYRDSFANMLRLVKAMFDAGVTVESGTDSTAGFTLVRELELHVKAGLPAERVLADATLGAARIMKKDAQLGSITPHKLADLVLVDGDPTRHISDIRRTAMVVKNGVVYDPAAIARALGMTSVH